MLIKNSEVLRELRDRKHKEMALRLGEDFDPKDGGRMHILICGVAGCQSAGSLGIYEELNKRIEENGLQSEIKIISTGCMGLCAQGPLMVTYPDEIMYTHVEPSDVEEIWNSHVIGGKPVERLFATEADGTKIAHALKDHSFYSKQLKIALKNCGLINPLDIEEYIGVDGYGALAKCLDDMDPEDVIDTMKDAVLRGRGGAGFPLGVKWESAAREMAPVKYICCNADEGDPGAFMDRSILEGDPHSILEAMAIAGYACGAKQGYIYVRAEYPVAVERLGVAIKQAHEYGLLGKNILGRPFDFDIDIRLGAGAFVCGEATALMASIEGKRGEPRPKPPRSTEKGLFDCPTVLNNVETFANVPQIIMKGTDWFKAIGTEKSNGTKVFALGGKIENTGLVEVPMGTTLREVVFDIGGGVPGHLNFKAAQTGGPSGGCITSEHLDTPMDFDSLTKLGTMMGSGGLIVMAEDSCMVDIAKFFLDFTVDESCGKCPPCRIGTKRMLDITKKITEGKGNMDDLDELEDLAQMIKTGALCGLGQSAPNPVVSTLQYFKDEYIAHVRDKKCPAGVCVSMLKYIIMAETCRRCGICAKNCPVGAITGDKDHPYVIDQDKCIKCGVCMSKCPFKSILKNA